MHLIEKLYEQLTGRPYYTGRSMVDDFGPPPAVRRAQLEAEHAKRHGQRAEVTR